MTSEAPTQQGIRLEGSRLGAYLWRNNSGAYQDDSGRVVRYGLANESKRLNDALKSSDLIGFIPVVITPGMVGTTVAVFTAIEAKPPGWQRISSKREYAQNSFIQLVRSFGGRAGFAASVEAGLKILKGG